MYRGPVPPPSQPWRCAVPTPTCLKPDWSKWNDVLHPASLLQRPLPTLHQQAALNIVHMLLGAYGSSPFHSNFPACARSDSFRQLGSMQIDNMRWAQRQPTWIRRRIHLRHPVSQGFAWETSVHLFIYAKHSSREGDRGRRRPWTCEGRRCRSNFNSRSTLFYNPADRPRVSALVSS